MEIATESNKEVKEMLGILPNKEMTEFLQILRQPLIKITDSRIDKHLFFQWKKFGLTESLFKKEEKKSWNVLSILELTVLEIISMLWKRDIDENAIKNVVDILLDGEDLKDAINERIELLDSEHHVQITDKILNNDFISYLVEQKKTNPHLPSFCNIEAFIIGTLKLNRPFGLLIFEDGKIDFFITSFYTDNLGGRFLYDIFSKTFLNVSVKDVLNKVLTIGSGKATSKEFDVPTLFLKKGYDAATIASLFSNNESVNYSEEILPTDCHIEKTLQAHNDQDVLIKVRGGKKTSIRRIIINKNNNK
ncbi:MAG: hypothetical protein WD512_14710 [Candidatus Paceibacterota bacterium]